MCEFWCVNVNNSRDTPKQWIVLSPLPRLFILISIHTGAGPRVRSVNCYLTLKLSGVAWYSVVTVGVGPAYFAVHSSGYVVVWLGSWSVHMGPC